MDPSHLTEGTQPSIHPGCISSTGRGRVAASPTSTHTAQLIGGAISPSLFTSPNAHQVKILYDTLNLQSLLITNRIKFYILSTSK